MKKIFNAGTFLIIACTVIVNASEQSIRAINISGTVVDDPWPAKRMPFSIQGAKVYLSDLPSVFIASSQLAMNSDSAITDQAGKFVFNPVPVGNYRISVAHKDFNTRQFILTRNADTSVRISLVSKSAHASFTGTVWVPCPDSANCVRQPAAGCNVSVYKGNTIYPYTIQSEVVSPEITAPVFSTTTNASGQYSIDSVPITINGEYVIVSASLAGYAGESIDTTLWNMKTTQLDFLLIRLNNVKTDSLVVVPEKPTTKDSVTFRLYNADYCCCTVYRDNAATRSDTIIFLSFSYDGSNCNDCDCAAGGSWATFKTGHLAAGKYSVYKVGIPYCAAQPCPAIKLAPLRVGTITVVNATGVSDRNGHNPAITTSPRFMIAGSQLNAELPQSAVVTIRAFSLRGELLAKPIESFLSAGSHRIALSSLFSETLTHKPIVLTMQINGITTDRAIVMNKKGK